MDTNCHTTCEAPGEVTRGVRPTVSPFGLSDGCPRTHYHNFDYPAIQFQFSAGLNQIRNGEFASQINMILASNTKVMRPLFIKDSTGVVAGFKPQFVNGRLITQGGSFVVRGSGPLPLIKASDIDYATSTEFVLGGSSVKSACGDNSNCPCGGPITLGKIPSGEVEPPPAILAVDDEIFIDFESPAEWDIGAHEFDGTGLTSPAEFDVVGATYYAVAPAGYVYDGTQNTNYSTRKYNTLFAAEAALPASATTPIVINIIGDWTGVTDTTAVVFSGTTTTAANYVLVRAIGTARHEGVWSLSKYRLHVANARALDVRVNFFRLDGLLVGKSSSSANDQACIYVGTVSTLNEVHLSNCVSRQAGNVLYREGNIVLSDSQLIAFVWNCIAYGSSAYEDDSNAGLSVGGCSLVKVYSSTFIGGASGSGVYCGSQFYGVTLRNCYADKFFFVGPHNTVTTTMCASADASGDAGFTGIPHSIATFANVTPGAEDYNLVTGSGLIGRGLTIEGDHTPLNFTTDIFGKTRDAFIAPVAAAVAWDIGAHDFSVGALVSPAEFDVVGATYYAVAPAGYVYNGTQDTNYSTRKYNTLSDAQVALPATATTPIVINIIGDWTASADTTAVDFANTVTSASNYILVRTIGTARHAGVWDTTKYRLETGISVLQLLDDHIRVDGLQIRKTGTGSTTSAVSFEADGVGNDQRLSNCILRGSGLSTNNDLVIYIPIPEPVVKIWNCIVYGCGAYRDINNAAIQIRSSATVDIYSSIIIGGYIGIFNRGYFGATAALTVKNCYALSGQEAYYSVDPDSMTLESCASGDDTGSIGLRVVPHDITTFTNVTPGSEDYRLVLGSPLISAGPDTSSGTAPLNFITDIAGYTR